MKGRKQLYLALALICYWGLPFGSYARVINVPKDYLQIQDAILNSQKGDEIIVAPGVYRNFSFLGQDIVVRSIFTGNWSVVQNTIIEGVYGSNVIGFSDSETSSCVLRGFTIRAGYGAIIGNGAHATIEYNLITNNDNAMALGNLELGGGIKGCDGLIQNNIICYNRSNSGGALAYCNGTIQNNLIYQNASMTGSSGGAGGALGRCNGIIRNNTIVDNAVIINGVAKPGGLVECTGTIVNNIIYTTTMTAEMEYLFNATPTYCLFRDAHTGLGNITGDPKFVDPTKGDYHLKTDSPAIDAGKRFNDLTADFEGHQRGLKAAPTSGGNGSGADIGAYEALPKPVAVWLPNGGPPGKIMEGQSLTVSWLLDPAAGTAIHLFLRSGATIIKDYGTFTAAGGSATTTLNLPSRLTSGAGYTILGRSAATSAWSSSASIKITGSNAVSPQSWLSYY